MRVEHASFASPLTFDDDEVAHVDVVPDQITFRQRSQTNRKTIVYAGDEAFNLEIVFVMAGRSTSEKLDAIRALQDTFRVYPFLLESSAEFLDCIWEGSDYREQWVRGRLEAGHELAVTWEEQLTGTCP